MSFIKTSRKKIDSDLAQSKLRKFFSPIIYAQYKITIPTTQNYVNGNLIDIGCGYSPYKKYLENYVNNYQGIDLFPFNQDVTYIGDFFDDNFFHDNQFDCALSFEVLEHVSNSDKFLSKIYRILKPNGFLIISVPHLSRLHEEPHDYFRFTKYGLSEIFTKNGFTIIEMKTKGGLFSFLGHQVSNLLVSTFWLLPMIKYIILYLNFLLFTLPCFWIDKLLDKNGIFAQGYVVVAKKIE